MQWEFAPCGKVLLKRNITLCLTSRVLHRCEKMFLCQSVFFTWWLMPSVVYTRPNRKAEMLSATRPAWQLICPLWLFSILFTKGKHIFKTLFCLIKSAWKFGDTVYSQGTCLTHSILFSNNRIGEYLCSTTQSYLGVSSVPSAILCLIRCSQASCSSCRVLHIMPCCPQLLLTLQVPAEISLLHKVPWMPKEQNWVL